MNSIKFINTLVLCLLLINSARGGAGEVCLQLSSHVSDEPLPEVIRGFPGKRGESGPSGLKGEKGDVIRCRCHPNEVEELREEIRNFNQTMERRLNEAIEQFSRKRDEPCNPNPCYNRGTCFSKPDNYTCKCLSGYDGINCTNNIECIVPASPKYGSISTNMLKILYKENITYTCDDGYGLSQLETDELTVTCQSDRTWSSSRPICLGINCDVPNPPPGGTISTNLTRLPVDDYVTYRCNYGFEMIGQESNELTVTCRNDRTWSHNVPICQGIDCDVPTPPQHGFVSTNLTKVLFRHNITYSCNHGYQLEQHETNFLTVTCQIDRSWSRLKPTCRPEPCNTKPCYNGGTCFSNVHDYTCKCRDGYDGINCTRNIECIVPAPPDHGSVSTNATKILFNGSIVYSCDHGYAFYQYETSQLTVTCQSDRGWSNERPICLEIDCVVPSPPDHGSINSVNAAKIAFNGNITYNCDDGYETAVQGTSDAVTVTCQIDRSWSGEIRCNHCGTVGLQNSAIADNQITASSSYDSRYLPHYARLNNQPSGSHDGCWHPSYPYTAGQWIQLNLQSPHRVSGIITQGYSGGNLYITTYKISYGNSTSDMNIIQENNNDKIFQGNTAGFTNTVTNRFSPPITATYFRLIVQTWNRAPVLRMEFLTC